jgi:hypothetical protein
MLIQFFYTLRAAESGVVVVVREHLTLLALQ